MINDYYILSPHFNKGSIIHREVDDIGQKAIGLFKTTSSIVPPFAVIFSSVFNIWYSVDQLKAEEILDSILLQIKDIFARKNISNFIVRSSAKHESFAEKGFYESSEFTDIKDLKTTIINTWYGNVEYFKKFPSNKLAIIIQEYIKPALTGHLSNERRISRSKTNFLYEIVDDKKNFIENSTFSLSSNNKKKYEYNLLEGLKSPNKKALITSIKHLSSYLLEDNCRHHIEWVWDKSHLWVVQNDIEDEFEKGNLPGSKWKISDAIKENREMASFSLLVNHKKNWRKIKCVKTFLDCDLPYGQIYILEDSELIKQLSVGYRDNNLLEDLKWLLQFPVVIRMDTLKSDEYGNTLLPRTETLFDADSVFEFLSTHSIKFIEKGISEENFCFLIHRYINAKACALAFSKPGIPKAIVDSTWGIVDGLYYHPHDSFEINLLNDVVKKKIRCKTEYLDVSREGSWISIKAGTDWDWAESLTKKQLLKIAKYNSQISKLLDQPVTVMYFVDVDINTGYPSILPWFYTTEEIESSSEKFTDIIFSEKREIIKNEDDFTRLKLKIANSESSKFSIKLKLNTNFLRDKNFIENVGTYAKDNKIPIELEGSILSHTYYILQKNGAQVKCVDPFNPTYGKQQFYKLVRDKIPVNIESKGEKTNIVHIDTAQILDFLKEKAVEEALEFFWENDKDKIIEELADIYEVIRSTCKLFGIDIKEINDVADIKTKSKGSFEEGLLLLDTAESSLISSNQIKTEKKIKSFNKSVKLKREKLKIQTNQNENSITLPYIMGSFQKLGTRQIKFGTVFQNKNVEIVYTNKGIKIFLDTETASTNPNQLNLF